MFRYHNKTDQHTTLARLANSWVERAFLMFMAFASMWLIAPQPAHAYVNLATGSLLMQMWAASWLALLFYGKVIWRTVCDYIKVHYAQKSWHA